MSHSTCLEAAVQVLRQPQWKVLTAAIEVYVDSLKDDRGEIRRRAKDGQSRCSKCQA